MHTPTLGVVIGRFQVPELHSGHHHLIRTAARENTAVLVIIGSGRSLATARNPLPFSVRRQMVLMDYPAAQVVEHFDHPSDHAWSEGLDAIITALFPGHVVTLYGSRDSFFPYYHGQFQTKAVAAIECESGTDLRNALLKNPPHTSDFRRGLIYAEQSRLSISYQAVDVAIIGGNRDSLLLGQKPTDGGKWRFVGGFVDARLDQSLEAAARREAYEETGGLGVDHFVYRGSVVVNDWRYRRDDDVVMTALFSASYTFGAPRATDDLSDLRWFRWHEVQAVIHECHQPLFTLLDRSI